MKKCVYCKTKVLTEGKACSVCGIELNKSKNELTKEEKKIVYFCRAICVVGILSIVRGIYGILIIIIFCLHYTLLGSILGLLLNSYAIFLGLELLRYKKWCYVGGIVYIAYNLTSNLMPHAMPSYSMMIIDVLCLYYIANLTSKSIFYREKVL